MRICLGWWKKVRTTVRRRDLVASLAAAVASGDELMDIVCVVAGEMDWSCKLVRNNECQVGSSEGRSAYEGRCRTVQVVVKVFFGILRMREVA